MNRTLSMWFLGIAILAFIGAGILLLPYIFTFAPISKITVPELDGGVLGLVFGFFQLFASCYYAKKDRTVNRS